MIFRQEFAQAGGDLTVAIARCLLCDRPRTAVRGDAFAVEVECRDCNIDQATRELRCPACNRHLFDLGGQHFKIDVRCDRCDTQVSVRRQSSRVTFVSVVRPMTGRIAHRFGIRPTPSRPETPASAAPLRSCAT